MFTEVSRGVHDEAIQDKGALALILHIPPHVLKTPLNRSRFPAAGIVFRRTVGRGRARSLRRRAPAALPGVGVLVQHVRARLADVLRARALEPPRKAEPLEEEDHPLGRVPVVTRGPGAVVVRKSVLSGIGEYRCALARCVHDGLTCCVSAKG